MFNLKFAHHFDWTSYITYWTQLGPFVLYKTEKKSTFRGGISHQIGLLHMFCFCWGFFCLFCFFDNGDVTPHKWKMLLHSIKWNINDNNTFYFIGTFLSPKPEYMLILRYLSKSHKPHSHRPHILSHLQWCMVYSLQLNVHVGKNESEWIDSTYLWPHNGLYQLLCPFIWQGRDFMYD